MAGYLILSPQFPPKTVYIISKYLLILQKEDSDSHGQVMILMSETTNYA